MPLARASKAGVLNCGLLQVDLPGTVRAGADCAVEEDGVDGRFLQVHRQPAAAAIRAGAAAASTQAGEALHQRHPRAGRILNEVRDDRDGGDNSLEEPARNAAGLDVIDREIEVGRGQIELPGEVGPQAGAGSAGAAEDGFGGERAAEDAFTIRLERVDQRGQGNGLRVEGDGVFHSRHPQVHIHLRVHRRAVEGQFYWVHHDVPAVDLRYGLPIGYLHFAQIEAPDVGLGSEVAEGQWLRLGRRLGAGGGPGRSGGGWPGLRGGAGFVGRGRLVLAAKEVVVAGQIERIRRQLQVALVALVSDMSSLPVSTS